MKQLRARILSIPLALMVVACQFLSGGATPGMASATNQDSLETPVPDNLTTADHANRLLLPLVTKSSGTPVTINGGDWPQLGRDPQRTNATPEQVDPPYCYAWKWYGVPFASRAQPVVAAGRLFIGGLDGVLYARNATTGEALWAFTTGGPIRNSPGVGNSTVVVSSYDGYTYGLNVATGNLLWQAATGSSATAPLIDTANGRVFVGSTDGRITALTLNSGGTLWTYSSGAAVLTSPALSVDGSTVFFGNEAIRAIALNSSNGSLRWSTTLQGQSLADRYPVVNGNSVYYRSQPLYSFHDMLHAGDDILDSAGSLLSNWAQDWAKVRPKIVSALNQDTEQQTLFALNVANGNSLGTLPVLYTFGNDDIPASPVIKDGKVYVAYRARHGIQNDSGTTHVTTEYDAELGELNPSSLDITGLQANARLASNQSINNTLEFRLTSDEPGVLTMGGNILWVDNWERLGGVNVQTGGLVYGSNVSNTWPECGSDCGPGGINPYFPLSGSGAAYPFPAPRVNEGHARGGAVIANGMVYWRVIEGGIGALAHGSYGCGGTKVYSDHAADTQAQDEPLSTAAVSARALADYVSLDLTTPVANPSADLVNRLRSEITAMLDLANGQHLLPIFVERGFTDTTLWPYTNSGDGDGMPALTYNYQGNGFWYDPGELLYTLAMAYPYLDSALQSRVKSYVSQEWNRYPPLEDFPWNGLPLAWANQGAQRELYSVPFRADLNCFPPPEVNYATLYSLWLWSKNTNDYSYASSHWSQIQSIYTNHRNSILYYADVAGAIGYARLAKAVKGASSTEYTNGLNSAVSAMQTGLNFGSFKDRANTDYMDPRESPSGWNTPVFNGLVPEVGLYLREQTFTGGVPGSYLTSLESYDSDGVGLIWWYLTRAGAHAEVGETSFELPTAGWSHFLGHAYILGQAQSTLRKYLDRPWTTGDLYSIQKIVAAIQAP